MIEVLAVSGEIEAKVCSDCGTQWNLLLYCFQLVYCYGWVGISLIDIGCTYLQHHYARRLAVSSAMDP